MTQLKDLRVGAMVLIVVVCCGIACCASANNTACPVPCHEVGTVPGNNQLMDANHCACACRAGFTGASCNLTTTPSRQLTTSHPSHTTTSRAASQSRRVVLQGTSTLSINSSRTIRSQRRSAFLTTTSSKPQQGAFSLSRTASIAAATRSFTDLPLLPSRTHTAIDTVSARMRFTTSTPGVYLTKTRTSTRTRTSNRSSTQRLDLTRTSTGTKTSTRAGTRTSTSTQSMDLTRTRTSTTSVDGTRTRSTSVSLTDGGTRTVSVSQSPSMIVSASLMLNVTQSRHPGSSTASFVVTVSESSSISKSMSDTLSMSPPTLSSALTPTKPSGSLSSSRSRPTATSSASPHQSASRTLSLSQRVLPTPTWNATPTTTNNLSSQSTTLSPSWSRRSPSRASTASESGSNPTSQSLSSSKESATFRISVSMSRSQLARSSTQSASLTSPRTSSLSDVASLTRPPTQTELVTPSSSSTMDRATSTGSSTFGVSSSISVSASRSGHTAEITGTTSLTPSTTSSTSVSASPIESATLSKPVTLTNTTNATRTMDTSQTQRMTLSRTMVPSASASARGASATSTASLSHSHTSDVTATRSISVTNALTSSTSFSYSQMSVSSSCPTVAPLASILNVVAPTDGSPGYSGRLSDLGNTVDTDPQRACALQANASAILTNGTYVVCFPMYATGGSFSIAGGRVAEGHVVRSVFPSSRGPAPPFLIAIRVFHDANWVMRLVGSATTTTTAASTNTSSASSLTSTSSTAAALLLQDPINGSNGAFLPALNLSMATQTLFILVTATPEWMSTVSVEVDATCGYQHQYPTFAVTWPQKQLSTAQQVIVGLVTGGSTLSGNPTAASALAMVGLLSCSGSTPALQSAGYFVSLFFNLGPAAVGAGNLGLIAALFGLHYGAVRAWMAHDGVTLTEAMSDARFPALSIFAAMFLLPGAVYGGVVSLASGDNMAVGVCVLVVVVALVVASQVFLVKNVIPEAFFEAYPCLHPFALRFERLVLLPSARWVPEAVERRYMPLMGTRTKDWSMLSVADLLLAMCLSAATGLGVGTNGASCSVMPIIVAVVYFSCALLHIGLRPHRRPVDVLVFPVAWTLFGTLCLLKYLNMAENAIDKLQLGLSSLQLFQTACAVWVFFRERQWRSYVQTLCDEEAADVDRRTRGEDDLLNFIVAEGADTASPLRMDVSAFALDLNAPAGSAEYDAMYNQMVDEFWGTTAARDHMSPFLDSGVKRVSSGALRLNAARRHVEESDVLRALRLAPPLLGRDEYDVHADEVMVEMDNMLLGPSLPPSSSPRKRQPNGRAHDSDDASEIFTPPVQPLSLLVPQSRPTDANSNRLPTLSKFVSSRKRKS